MDGFLGSGTREGVEGGEGHSAGLDVRGRGAPRGPCPGEASSAWSTTLPTSRELDALCFGGPQHPPRASLSREEEADLSQAMLGALGCGLWPVAVAPGALGDGEAWRDHLSAPLSLGAGGRSFHLCLQRAGPEAGPGFIATTKVAYYEMHAWVNCPKEGLAKNTLKPRHLRNF